MMNFGTLLVSLTSASLLMPLGLFFWTMSASRLRTKILGSDALPASVTFFMFASSAEANTSAGAPLLAWVASVEEESKENFTWTPGLAASNDFPISVKASVSEAAASTVMSPLSLGSVVVVVGAVVVVVVVAFLVVVVTLAATVVVVAAAAVVVVVASVDVVVEASVTLVVVWLAATSFLLSSPHAAPSRTRATKTAAHGRRVAGCGVCR